MQCTPPELSLCSKMLTQICVVCAGMRSWRRGSERLTEREPSTFMPVLWPILGGILPSGLTGTPLRYQQCTSHSCSPLTCQPSAILQTGNLIPYITLPYIYFFLTPENRKSLKKQGEKRRQKAPGCTSSALLTVLSRFS